MKLHVPAAVRDWFTLTLPDLTSGWLLRAYRRPLPVLLSVVVLPLSSIFAATYIMNTALWRRQTLHNLTVTARLAAEIVNETLEETFRTERLLASHPGFIDAVRRVDKEELGKRLEQTLTLTPRVDLAHVIDPDGRSLASFPFRARIDERPFATEEPFLGAKGGGTWRSYVSAVYLRDDPPAEKVVGVMLPVESQGQVIAVIQFQHLVEEIKSWLQKLRVEPEGFLYVADHRGQLVVYPFQVLPGKPRSVTDWPPVAVPLGEEGASLIFRGSSGKRWLAGIHPVGDTGWRVVAVQPEAAALRVLSRTLWPTAGLVALLMLLLVILSLRWARLQNSTMDLLRQNTKLLKQMQQRRALGPGKEGDA
jgi:hypothetical protein